MKRRMVSETAFPVLGLLIASLALASCGAGGRGGPIPYDRKDFGAPDPVVAVPLEQNYRIAPLDTVSIKVFKMPDLSGDYEVDLTGKLSMPLVGDVQAFDLTTRQLGDKLTALYGAKYLENPSITVGVKSSTRRSVTVDGSVKSSGLFPISGPTTLIQAIAQAGGVGEDANPRRVAIFRTIGGQRQAAAFDLVSIRRGEAPDPQVYPGDIVVVDGSSLKALQRQLLNSIPILSVFGPL